MILIFSCARISTLPVVGILILILVALGGPGARTLIFLQQHIVTLRRQRLIPQWLLHGASHRPARTILPCSRPHTLSIAALARSNGIFGGGPVVVVETVDAFLEVRLLLRPHHSILSLQLRLLLPVLLFFDLDVFGRSVLEVVGHCVCVCVSGDVLEDCEMGFMGDFRNYYKEEAQIKFISDIKFYK